MKEIVSNIKQQIDIVTYIDKFVKLKKSGKNYKACCPFHQEKTPSFYVSEDRQMWYCFGACHESGDIISFLMKYEKLSFIEALQELANEVGISLENIDIKDENSDKREILYKINSFAQKFYSHVLHNTGYGNKAKEYLKNRGLSDENIDFFGLGYAPSSWDNLLLFLKKKGFKEELLNESGLFSKGDHGIYDRFRGRIIFPIYDVRANIIGFSGRLMQESNSGEGKYINIPETFLYHKRESLYGINFAKEYIKKEKSVIVVEGEFDMIIPFSKGVKNIVAIKGSAITKEHVKLLQRYSSVIYWCLDADNAGNDAVFKVIQDFIDSDINMYVVRLSKGKDPDESIRTDKKQFLIDIKKSIPVYDYIIDTVRRKYPEQTAINKKIIVEKLSPFLILIKNPVLISHYMRQISKYLDISEESLNRTMQQYIRSEMTKNKFKKEPLEEKELISQEERTEKYIVASCIHHEEIFLNIEKLEEIINEKDFSILAIGKIFTALLELRKKTDKFDLQSFINNLPSELKPLFDVLWIKECKENAPPFEDIMQRAFNIKEKILIKRQKQENLSNEDMMNIKNELDKLRNIIYKK